MSILRPSSLYKKLAGREDLESLSDHLYISFSVNTGRFRLPPDRTNTRKWNLKKFDSDLFMASLIWRGGDVDIEDPLEVTQLIDWLGHAVVEASDVAAPRIGPKKPRRCAYWWQNSVAALRFQCIRARRSWQRAKKKNRSREVVEELGTAYKLRRKELRVEINRLKSNSWQELLDSINEDSWGLTYKLVLGKLRLLSPGLTELLDPDTLSTLLDSLSKEELPRPGRGLVGLPLVG